MNLVTEAVIKSFLAGVTRGATAVGENSVGDAYNGLKKLLKKKFGDAVVNAVIDLERNGHSEGQRLLLSEEFEKAGVLEDDEIVRAAGKILAMIHPRQTTIFYNPLPEQTSRGAVQAGHMGCISQIFQDADED